MQLSYKVMREESWVKNTETDGGECVSLLYDRQPEITNKMDKLALVRSWRDFCECSVMCSTETRLQEDTQDSITSINGFQMVQVDKKRNVSAAQTLNY